MAILNLTKAQRSLLMESERRSLEAIGSRLKLVYLGKKDGERYWAVLSPENPRYNDEVTLHELREFI